MQVEGTDQKFKYVYYKPKTQDGHENPLPIKLNTGKGILELNEQHFRDFFREYMEQKHLLDVKEAERKNDKDIRSIALECVAGIAHRLEYGWNTGGEFYESFLDELLLWTDALDQLRPTFGICRFYPNQYTSQQVVNLRSKLRKAIDECFDFWAKADETRKASGKEAK